MNNDYLQHHGILGQKWGIRRFQNPNGTLTEEGRKRYGIDKLDANNKSDIKNLSDKQRINALRKERTNLYSQVKKNAPKPDYESIYEEAQRRYDEKVAKGKVEYNPDDWDYEYEEKELKKWENLTINARKEVDKYLEKKYDINIEDFDKSEKERIKKGEKFLENGEKILAGVAATALIASMALAIKKDSSK